MNEELEKAIVAYELEKQKCPPGQHQHEGIEGCHAVSQKHRGEGAAESKRPWQMTADEYVKDMIDYWKRTRGSGIKGTKAPELPVDIEDRMRAYHKNLVEEALSEGKAVPPKVLRS